MKNLSHARVRSPAGRLVRLNLHDREVVEGHVPAVAGQPLTACLGNRKGWINLTDVRVGPGGEAQPHVAVPTKRILWASSPDASLPLAGDPGPMSRHRVEIRTGDGLVLDGWLALLPRQRLSDFLAAFGEFIPLRDARLASTDETLGDIAVNQENIEGLDEVPDGDVPAAPADAPAGKGGRGKGDRSASRHWLLNVAAAGGARGAANLTAPASMPIEEAWAIVTEGCGITDAALTAMIAERYRLAVADLESANHDVIQRIPERVARKYNAFPLREDDDHLVIATSDPTDHDAEQALRFASRKPPIFEIAAPAALRELVNARYSSVKEVEALLSSVDDAHDVRIVEDIGPESVGGAEAIAAPIIKLTNVILRDAVRDGASDIHLEPSNGAGIVRLRVDGVLRHHMQMPLVVLNRVISRIKILGELDIADRLRPQDGRSRVQVDGRVHDLRISTVPTRQAEKAVIRVLNPEGNRSLDDLYILPQEMTRIRRLLGVREGIVVVTGPTGSGKTTTLYSALREVASGEINVMSVEDPVEYELHGITQIQVEPDRGVTFASALRAILRQDPDVIFIGEIRDAETAEIAVHAAMTGHLVLATLHTNDAVSSVARLVHLGLDRTSIATTLIGAMAQRLVRRVCSQCAEPVKGHLTSEETRLEAEYGVSPAVRARGCQRCGQTGYRGRLPLLEVALVDSNVREMIARNATTLDLFRAAITDGMRPLMKVAMERVQMGDTTLQEIERVLGLPDDEDLYEQYSPDTAQGRIHAEARNEARRTRASSGPDIAQLPLA